MYKDNNVRITATEQAWQLGLLVCLPRRLLQTGWKRGRTIVFSSDTALFDGMEEVYAGADVLFHQAYSFIEPIHTTPRHL